MAHLDRNEYRRVGNGPNLLSCMALAGENDFRFSFSFPKTRLERHTAEVGVRCQGEGRPAQMWRPGAPLDCAQWRKGTRPWLTSSGPGAAETPGGKAVRYAATCFEKGTVLISILRGKAAAAMGAVISSTPFTYSAVSLSMFTPSGIVNSLSKEP